MPSSRLLARVRTEKNYSSQAPRLSALPFTVRITGYTQLTSTSGVYSLSYRPSPRCAAFRRAPLFTTLNERMLALLPRNAAMARCSMRMDSMALQVGTARTGS